MQPVKNVKRNNNRRLVAAVLLVAVAGTAFVLIGQNADKPGGALAVLKPKPKATPISWSVAVSDFAGDGTTGFADAPGRQARFADPYGLAQGRDGTLFVADAGDNNRIRVIAPDGTVSTLAGDREGFTDGAGAAAAFHTPSGLAIDAAGNLYVADTGNNAIRKVSPQGVVTTLAGDGTAGYQDGPAAQARFNGPLGVAVDARGNVYVADTYNDRIRMIGADGNVATLAGLGAPGYADGLAAEAMFDTPTAILLDAQGALLIADTRNGAIRKLDAAGQVSTLAKAADNEEKPLMRRPVSMALTPDGVLYIGDMARGRILQLAADGTLHGLTGIGIDIEIGDAQSVRFDRPTAMVLGRDGLPIVADARRRVVRKLAPRSATAPLIAQNAVATPEPAKAGSFPWPFKPQTGWHEVVGTIGEVRGTYSGESRHHFHNGLDVQADMGVPVLAVAAEKISDPLPNWGFGEVGEGLSVDAISYIHMRVGRTIKDEPVDPARFTLLAGDKGKPVRVRVKRGTRFNVGDTVGTVNRLFHVHLVHRPPGGENNPLQLGFSGFSDGIAPQVESIALLDANEKALAKKKGKRLLVPRDGGPLSIVADAYDQADGNAKRRRLGLYKVGYQLLDAKDQPLPGFEAPRMNIEFNRLPPDQESVKVAYAANSGVTVHGSAITRFQYVVTNTVRDGAARSGSWDPSTLTPGDYTIRIHAFDYAGNEARNGRDLAITVE
jgi:sugar lactone lactonase YvrE